MGEWKRGEMAQGSTMLENRVRVCVLCLQLESGHADAGECAGELVVSDPVEDVDATCDDDEQHDARRDQQDERARHVDLLARSTRLQTMRNPGSVHRSPPARS